MNEEIRKALEVELKKQIDELRDLPAGSKERETAVENVTKLLRIIVEDRKNEYDYGLKFEEYEQKQVATKETRIKEIVRMVMEAISTVLPFGTFLLAFSAGLEFEKEGTIVSPWQKAMINSIVPRFFKKK